MAQPKKNFKNLIPLPILLSLSALFLFTFSPSTPFTAHPAAQPNLQTSTTTTTADNKNFTFIIKLLTYNRLSSLTRCLSSLAAAHYDGHAVHLHIFIDHFPVPPNGSLYIDQNLNSSKGILDFVDGFAWELGSKVVLYRTSNAGLQAQWLEAWWPSSDDEFAFVVEDDLEVSSLYFRFLKNLIMHYYYNASNFSPIIFGASLQRPRFVPGKHGNKMEVDSRTRVFLYQLVGTWGQLLFPRPWKEFRLWYDTHKSKDIKPFLDGMVTTGWYKKMGERIWTPWFIKFIHARGYFNIYTNLLHERALSVSHRDAGVNYGKSAGPDSNLVSENSIDANHLELHPLHSMNWYDFCFKRVFPDRIVQNFNELGSVLPSLQKLSNIILVSIHQEPESVVRNLLCHFERQHIQNYILMGPKSDLLLDLARRGHPVIDSGRIYDNIRAFDNSTLELSKEIFIKSYVVRKFLEHGFSIIVTDVNRLPLNNDSYLNLFELDRAYDFFVGKNFELILVKSSSSALKTWNDNVLTGLGNDVISTSSNSSVPTGKDFVYVVKKLFEQKRVKFYTFDENSSSLNTNSLNATHMSIRDDARFVFWSSEVSSDLIQQQLVHLGLWVVDSDMSCTSIICYPS
ncbi:hypothetical protein DM860_014817 [Cuscuta australis]|uniref:Nucleotide-diphospho-sugar transferase domain-containing protein n=1 Tax=Cuscuta australis TaxID=267555 RepID=A0A328D3J8_9ASTE|nr:hypothetical protein DM860_014817 [Cuscuta australis]